MTKYGRYQDYVIRDGKFVGEFEQMYRDFDDPWHQSEKEDSAGDKIIGVHLLKRARAHAGKRRVLEFGCGFGQYTAKIAEAGFDTLGVDISDTAVARARERHPGIAFRTGDILDFDLYRQFKPDVLVMPEITWYVLDKLRPLLDFLKAELPETWLLHHLTTYPPGEQKYGGDYFTDLDGILRFFDLHYLEAGEIRLPGGIKRTWFLGTSDPKALEGWHI